MFELATIQVRHLFASISRGVSDTHTLQPINPTFFIDYGLYYFLKKFKSKFRRSWGEKFPEQAIYKFQTSYLEVVFFPSGQSPTGCTHRVQRFSHCWKHLLKSRSVILFDTACVAGLVSAISSNVVLSTGIPSLDPGSLFSFLGLF